MSEGETRAVAGGSLSRRVWKALHPFRGPLAFALGQVLVISALELLKPWPLKIVVDSVLGDTPAPTGFLRELSPGVLLAACCLGLVALHAGLGALTYINNRTTIRIGQRMVNGLRGELYQHLLRLSHGFHARRSLGDLLYRLTGDTFAIQALTMNGLFPIVSALVFVVGMTVILLQIDPVLALVALAICPLLYASIRWMSERITDQSRLSRERESGLYSTVQRALSSIRVIQAFGREPQEQARFARRSQASLRASRRLYLAQTLYSSVINTLLAMGTAVVLWIGARRVLAGAMSVGDVLVFLSYLASLYAPVNAVSQTIGLIQEAKAGLLRVFEILDEKDTVQSGTRRLEAREVSGEIRFESVGFSYDSARQVLSDVSLTVPAGSSLALVGPTGSGKTTLLSLLPRFHDPSAGHVRLDGIDVREFDLHDLRRAIAVVLQPPIVFGATLRENIAYGKPGATPAEIEQAALLAQLEPVLARLPRGLDARIGEGGAFLSEGERQRLTIARALVRNAPILILDEPTSSLDGETEALLMAALRAGTNGRTLLLIAHRLSTVRQADQIAVLREGRIVESGDFASLVARDGFFARLARLQDGDADPALLGSSQ